MGDKARFATLVPMGEIEAGARKQIQDALGLPFLKRLAIMPDVHQGYDLPIGAVALLDGKVSPSYVGYDIGCGMCMCGTGRTFEEAFGGPRGSGRGEDALRFAYDQLRRQIPSGSSGHARRREDAPRFRFSGDFPLRENKNWRSLRELEARINDRIGVQLGTLGSGNHFLEVGVGEATGEVCVTIHSGSRKPGWLVAWAYMGAARFIDAGSDLGRAYLADMEFMLDFALDNRRRMMREALACLGIRGREADDVMGGMVNENHNHAVVRPDGVLHRKGATPAELGQRGIIPISMGCGVYVTSGLGNDDYLSSASHGAGRLLGRAAAKKTLSMGDFRFDMEGILAPVREDTLDESPRAYKDEDYVIGPQRGVVVEVEDVARPVAVVKDSSADEGPEG